MATNVEHWVEESRRRGEEVVVIIRNKTTSEEVETEVNPVFLATMARGCEIKKKGDK